VKQIRILLVLVALCFVGVQSYAGEDCDLQRGIKTKFGLLRIEICKKEEKVTPPPGSTNPNNNINRIYSYSLRVDDTPILKEEFLSNLEGNKDRSLWVYGGKSSIETGCDANLYLIDLTHQPVKVIAFGVKNACNEFHWASWGDKRSVIALKSNVKFVYENGKLTPPAAGEKLYKAIEPPHSSRGEGLTQENAIPFVNDVPLPK
jgi:hypothetical protein